MQPSEADARHGRALASLRLRDVMRLTLQVIGVAQPMGSKRAFIPKGWSRPVVTDSNRGLKIVAAIGCAGRA